MCPTEIQDNTCPSVCSPITISAGPRIRLFIFCLYLVGHGLQINKKM